MTHNELKRTGLLFCLIGPTAGGKTTLGARMLAENKASLVLSVSATSRAPREGEREGEAYYFLSREDFQKKIDQGEFFEWEETHGNLYGTYRATVTDVIDSGTDLLLDIDIRGALNFQDEFPLHTVITFMVPPTPAVLQERIRARGKVSDKELNRRLETAHAEYAQLQEAAASGKIDYFVVNDKIDATHALLRCILEAERVRLGRLDKDFVRAVCRVK